ncbi:zinc-dependent alcohol dehydrogenase [Rubrimonas cliftonensis]|uniref:Threonine dehydrogenase n=1 Tax=Rubrimonas cliftonensis TaxID=89524 RepID=A0A1H4EEL6_9RHOB|nr:alcohol dehydrogenase catalytic domain-containing protein [Rubrimonas cliftonensis]SEA83514.1 Threonine dehydrogenase [Rubrimonas cliftonensis]
MKALVYLGPERLEVLEVSRPVPSEGEELVRVEAVGVCGSDMHAFLGHDPRRPAPLILGHEAAGVIDGGPRDGLRVTVNPLVTCGACPACRTGRDNLCPSRQIISMPPREGAFAGWVAMPSRNLVAIPEDVRTEAAALTEPLACGWHGVKLARRALAAAGDGPASRALVLGGGAIGLGAALSLAAQGVEDVTIVEPNALRRTVLIERCGQRAVAQETAGGFDVVIDGVGFAATRASASRQTRPGGVIVHIGLGEDEGGLDVRRMTLQEIAFIGTYTYTAEDFRETAAAIFDGHMGALDWTDIRPLGDGPAAFADIRAGRAAAPKIILIPRHDG